MIKTRAELSRELSEERRKNLSLQKRVNELERTVCRLQGGVELTSACTDIQEEREPVMTSGGVVCTSICENCRSLFYWDASQIRKGGTYMFRSTVRNGDFRLTGVKRDIGSEAVLCCKCLV